MYLYLYLSVRISHMVNPWKKQLNKLYDVWVAWLIGLGNHVLDGGPDPNRNGHFWGGACAAVQPFAKLLGTLIIIMVIILLLWKWARVVRWKDVWYVLWSGGSEVLRQARGNLEKGSWQRSEKSASKDKHSGL